MNLITRACVAGMLLLLLAGCASWVPQGGVKQAGSIVDYLYPDAKEPPQLQPSVTYLRPPVRVGIAFVPGSGWGNGLPEPEKTKLLERAKASFSQYAYIGSIEVIPSQYLRPKGGFANLEQLARMFNVDVIALISYDQMQFNDSNALSMLYWTIVGAYLVHGDQYDIHTMVDASVFDVQTHKLLFRAPGVSRVKGSASMAGFSERSRAARMEGYDKAVEDLIPQLHAELAKFRERIKSDAAYRIENRHGYTGGGAFDGRDVLLVVALGALICAARRAT